MGRRTDKFKGFFKSSEALQLPPPSPSSAQPPHLPSTSGISPGTLHYPGHLGPDTYLRPDQYFQHPYNQPSYQASHQPNPQVSYQDQNRPFHETSHHFPQAPSDSPNFQPVHQTAHLSTYNPDEQSAFRPEYRLSNSAGYTPTYPSTGQGPYPQNHEVISQPISQPSYNPEHQQTLQSDSQVPHSSNYPLHSRPEGQPSSASSLQTSTEISHTPEQGAQYLPSSSDGKSAYQPRITSGLWEKAWNSLSEQDRTLLGPLQGNSSPRVFREQIQQLASMKKQEAEVNAWKFRFRGRDIILRDVIGKIITWLNKFKDIGDIAVNFDPGQAALPWAAVRFILLAATADSQQHAQLLIDVPLDPNAMYNAENSMVHLYGKILSFLAIYVRLLDSSSTRRAMHALFHPDELAEHISGLENMESRVELEINNLERIYGRVVQQRLGERYDTLHHMLSRVLVRMHSQVDDLWTRQSEQMTSQILQWLSNISYESDHLSARNGRVEGTGDWLIQHKTFVDWHNTSASMILWLHGIPGSGKTKLSTKVVDHMSSLLSTGKSSEALAYFYCDRNREDHNQPLPLLQSIVRQISTNTNGSIASFLRDTYQKRELSGFSMSELSLSECQEFIMRMANTYSQTTLVVDGLDECNPDTRHIIMDTLDDMVTKSAHPVKVFIASRNDADLKVRYEQGRHLEITAADNQQDIETYVLNRINSVPLFTTKVSLQTQEVVISEFKKKSQGMFQWAVLHMNDLLKLRRDQDVLHYLKELPRGLKNAYDKIYTDLASREGSWKRVADAAFQWLICSYRPLSPDELVFAVCQDPGTLGIDATDIDIDFVLEACHNLVIVSKGDADICRFSHLSVQEYFEKSRFSKEQAHALVASVCLRIIISQYELHTVDHLLTDYIHGWFYHLRVSECGAASLYKSDCTLAELVKTFLPSPTTYSNECWWWWTTRDEESSELVSVPGVQSDHDGINLAEIKHVCELEDCSVVLLCVGLGLEGILKYWLDQDKHVLDTQFEGAKAALHIASMFGYLGIAKMLVESGELYINSVYETLGTALCTAAFNGHADVAQVLLQGGANPNIAGGYNTAPLHAAASRSGQKEMIKLLLEAGADINWSTPETGPALTCALLNIADIESVKVLLDHGADPNAEGGFYGSPLQTVVMMFEHGSPRRFDALKQSRDTVSHGRSDASAVSYVELLLDYGANPNKVSGAYGTALQAAAMMSRNEIVDTLLDRGADPNVRGGIFGSALEAASWVRSRYDYDLHALFISNRNLHILKRLLFKGARVEHGGANYGPVLYYFLVSQGEVDKNDRSMRDQFLGTDSGERFSPFYYERVLEEMCYMGSTSLRPLLKSKYKLVNLHWEEDEPREQQRVVWNDTDKVIHVFSNYDI